MYGRRAAWRLAADRPIDDGLASKVVTPRDGGEMEQTEMCYLCERPDMPRVLGIWFVNGKRWPVHTQCWIDAYRAGRLATDGRRLRT